MLDYIRCTVLNSNYQPLSVVSAKRALILTIEGKAVVTQQHPNHVVRSTHDVWPVPTQIVLKEYVHTRSTHQVRAVLTQRNLFLRDGYKCQYCGRHRSDLKQKEFLTRDHVIPLSKGGKDEWTNTVCSCNVCNNKKADFYLHEIKMVLKKVPNAPSIYELWARAGAAKSKNI